LAEIVGPDRVMDNPGIGESFSLDRTLHSAMRPSFRVRPGTVEQVREIVLWANETLTPLVPVSSGAPHLRGGTLPTVPESVMVDLSRDEAHPQDRPQEQASPDRAGGDLQPAPARASERGLAGDHAALAAQPTNRSSPASWKREPPMSPRYPVELCWNRCAAWRSCGATGTGSTAAVAPSAAKGKRIGSRGWYRCRDRGRGNWTFTSLSRLPRAAWASSPGPR
jgi:hypothetical protein